VKVKESKSPVKKAKAPVISSKSRRVKDSKTKTTRAPVKTTVREPTRKRDLKVLSKTSNNLLDSVFNEETKEDEKIKGWVLPPSLMAVAAVPGSPVINAKKVETNRVPKDVQEMADPYLQFMPVPAVPETEAEQAPRKPKESLTSLTLNLNLPNNLDAEMKTSKSATTSKAPRIKATKTFTTIAPRKTSSESILSNAVLFDEKKDARKKFKRCHGRCVQQFCLPVNEISVYAKCVDKCKLLCT